VTNEHAYALLVVLARRAVFDRTIADNPFAEPEPGDLVVEMTGWRRPADPDAIGWLLGHDDAPYGEGDPLDGSVPMREVWDVIPLNPEAKLQEFGGRRYQRWENADFRRIDPKLLERAGIVPPEVEAWV
jgi:hypothetical protein